MSNIAWFGDSIALPQHLQVSQMRALETGRPMLRATNTGATAIIQPNGEISAQLAPYTRATLAATVRGYQGSTPYILYGNYLMLALAALALAAGWLFSAKTAGQLDGMFVGVDPAIKQRVLFDHAAELFEIPRQRLEA